jgi:hypothetical protein
MTLSRMPYSRTIFKRTKLGRIRQNNNSHQNMTANKTITKLKFMLRGIRQSVIILNVAAPSHHSLLTSDKSYNYFHNLHISEE